MKLLAFDLDGTLTQHKTPIDPENRALIASLLPDYKIVLVGAGSCARIFSQLDGLPLPIIGHYGMQQSYIDRDGTLCLIRDDTTEVDRSEMARRAATLRSQFALFPFSGEMIEFHKSGMLTFPILGTAANPTDKLAYDPDRVKRRRLYATVCALFPEYTVVIGGTSSFDIIPKPYDKFYALSNYAASIAVSHKEIVYFGDDYGPGGNDESIYRSDIAFEPVDDYRALNTALARFLRKGASLQ